MGIEIKLDVQAIKAIEDAAVKSAEDRPYKCSDNAVRYRRYAE